MLKPQMQWLHQKYLDAYKGSWTGWTIRGLAIIAAAAALIGVISVAIFFATIKAIDWFTPHTLNSEQSGQFGDQFGFMNAVVSALAFGGLIVTILLQRRDLQVQTKEMTQARADAKVAAFEQMYFRLLELRETIIGSIRAIDEVKELTGDTSYVFGRRALKKHADGALVILQAVSAQMPAENELELKARREVFCKNYGRWYDHDAAIYLGHYFRTTYHCLRLVHDWPSEDLDLPARYGYARLLRAQLSDPELELLFCNCIGPIGWTRFMPLANYYHLFDNLRITGGRIDKNNRWFTLSWVVGPDRDMIGDERRFWLHDRETKLAEGQDFVGRGKGLGVLGHDLDPWPHDEVPQADTD